MKSWDDLVNESHERDHEGDGFQLVKMPPATSDEIDSLQKLIGIKLPDEFRDLYLAINGFGVVGKSAEIYWSFIPLDKILGFIASTREFFQDTHPDVAKRFFPFIDWSDGDASGYMISPSDRLLPSLFDFQHDDYEFEETQEGSEFLVTATRNIKDFIKD
jgi:hypothetical protein